MKNSERFTNAISALIKGFFNETLVKGSCKACAVGNIIANSMSYTTKKLDNGIVWNNQNGLPVDVNWFSVFCTNSAGKQRISPHFFKGKAKEEIESTGYSWQILAECESAFERATVIGYSWYDTHSQDKILADQYKGLIAVVEVLCKHEGIEDVQEYRDMFSYDVSKECELIPA